MNRYGVIAALVCSVIGAPVVTAIGVPMAAAQEQKAKPDATVDFTGASAAVGVGYSWGSGTLHYKDNNYPFSASGLTLADIGGGQNVVTAEVYKLNKVDDFRGYLFSCLRPVQPWLGVAGSDIWRMTRGSS